MSQSLPPPTSQTSVTTKIVGAALAAALLCLVLTFAAHPGFLVGFLVIIVGLVAWGMFAFAREVSRSYVPALQAQVGAQQQPPSPAPTAADSQLRAAGFAHALFADHPDGIDSRTFVDLCDGAGADPAIASRIYDELCSTREEAEQITVTVIDLSALRVMDLAHLDSTRMAIRGMSYYLADDERVSHGDTEYILVREPENEFDTKAVAVYSGRGRKMGFLSASQAAQFTPLLDQLDVDAFVIGGALVDGRHPRIDVPRVPELRAFVRRASRGLESAV